MLLSTAQPSLPVNAWLRSMDSHYITLIMEDPKPEKLCGKYLEVGCFDAYFLEVVIDTPLGHAFTKDSSLTTHPLPPLPPPFFPSRVS
jgi:hypothetical protein